MKQYAILLAALLFTSFPAIASGEDDEPFAKSFSLELGTGIQPLHMTLMPTRADKTALAKLGQQYNNAEDEFCPVISLSEVWRVAPHWELCLTEGVSWKIMQIIQYDTFGIGPGGEPRYDLDKWSPAGVKSSSPVVSLAFQARFIWSPKWAVTVYSALGAGFTTVTSFYPMPEVTPIAIRFGKKHFYGFAEATIGPIASLVHGGIGWKF